MATYKVKIKKLPVAKAGQQVAGGLYNPIATFGGADSNSDISVPDLNSKRTLTKVPREEANLEAEGGETAFGDINGDGFTEHYNIEGPRHSSGGVPLNLPPQTFIYSDTRDMKIKDPRLLAKFGKSTTSSKKTKSYTPAELAKQYDINKYRKILEDPNSDKIEKKTAELMIKTYNLKLGALALVQESQKGFPQDIPFVATPYMQHMGINPEDIKPSIPSIEEQQAVQTFAYGGNIPKYQDKGEVKDGYDPKKWNNDKEAYDNFMALKTALESNPEFRSKIVKNYKKAIENPANYTGGKKQNWYKPLSEKASEEQIIKALLDQEERNARLEAFQYDAGSTENKASAGVLKGTNKETLDFVRNTPGLEDLDFSRGYVGQAAYIAYDDTLKEMGLKDYGAEQFGQADELKGRPTISGIDNASTNTTLMQRLKYIPPASTEKPAAQTQLEETPSVDKKDVQPSDTRYIPEDFGTPPKVIPADWTMPAKLNYMNAVKQRMAGKKYLPWAPNVDLETADPTLMDPTRELASLGENAYTMAQGLAQFTGPQAASARASNIQGNLAKDVANTMARYEGANAQIKNQFELQNTGIRNQEQMMNQQLADRLYDENVIANQNYDNYRQAATQNMINAFAAGQDEAGKIASLNAMYDQYYVDPTTRTVVFKGGKKAKPERSTSFDDLLEKYMAMGMKPDEARRAAKDVLTLNSGQNAGLNPDDLVSAYKRGGYIMGDMIFPFY